MILGDLIACVAWNDFKSFMRKKKVLSFNKII